MNDEVRYSRDVLEDVLVYHQRTSSSGCGCGWAVLGASHAEHILDVYEESIRHYDEDDAE